MSIGLHCLTHELHRRDRPSAATGRAEAHACSPPPPDADPNDPPAAAAADPDDPPAPQLRRPSLVPEAASSHALCDSCLNKAEVRLIAYITKEAHTTLSCSFKISMDIEKNEAEDVAADALEPLLDAAVGERHLSNLVEEPAKAALEQEPHLVVEQIDSIHDKYDINMLEQTQNSSSFNHKEEFPPAMISRHNKPKKAHISQVMPQDYICTEEDLKIIQYIKSLPKKGTLVEIGDAFIDRFHMECLFHDYMKLNGDVISAYIHCIRAEEHLLHREGGKVFLENTFISSILRRDGDPKMDQISYKEDKIASRVNNYLDHDMIFLPINIAEKALLAGLERHIELAAEDNELKQHKWRDLEVASWPVIEVFQQPMQTDGDDIKKFRFKLPEILWASRLNTKKGCQVQEQINEESDSASDIEIIDAPDVISVPSTITHVVESNKAPCILSRGLSPTKRWELLDALCGYIMLIDDAGSLE
ncbi:hypothetical protein ACP4OV_007355 [Aristida adscensionis]